MKMQIKHLDGSVLYEAEAQTVSELLCLAVKDSANLSWADLSWADLSSANLRSADLSWADLSSANLRSANLRSANLNWADLSSANLRSANLRSANLRSADLSWADLSSANLSSADLSSADLSWADLSSANLSSADLRSADLNSATIIETGETWAQYLEQVIPAFLTAGGKQLAEVLTVKNWDCHSWDNCPTACAFDTHSIDGVPLLLRPRAQQFIHYFNAKLIPLEAVGKKAI